MGYKTRRHARHQTNQLPMVLRPVGTFAWLRGSVLNLSAGGLQIFLGSSEKLELGTKLELEFNTVDRQGRKNRRKLAATVMWRAGQRYGCQFTKR